MASTLFHPAGTRIHANLGWLNAYRSFNPGNAPEPSRDSFGALLILNDDTVAEGRGFGMHSHQNMEILTLPLTGALAHEDSLGNQGVIRTGEVQVMSAGTGIAHSEKNHNPHESAHFLQIWIATDQPGATPRYGQQAYAPVANGLAQVASPHEGQAGVQLRQQAWLHVGTLSPGTTVPYAIKQPGNGVYALVLEGEVDIDSQRLTAFDALGIWNTDQLTLKALSPARVLLIDVPMRT